MLQKGLPVLTNQQGETNADVAAIATYFSLDENEFNQLYADYQANQVDLDRVFSELKTNIDDAAKTWLRNREIANEYGVSLVSYEGGQHLVPRDAGQRNDGGFTQLLFDIQRDPRMGDMYTYLAEKWREIGGTTLTLFNNMDPWSKSGAWGLKEGFDDLVAPKFDAVQAYLMANPGGWDQRTGNWLGDVDGNGMLDVTDVDLLAAAIRQGDGDERWDLNRDGLVDFNDHRFWVTELKQTVLGDTNLDGLLETADLVLALTAGGYEDALIGNSTWETGDWNGDGEFDTADLVAVMESGQLNRVNAATFAVPEPASCSLLSLVVLAAWTPWRRRPTL